jgi:hypothetical protein
MKKLLFLLFFIPCISFATERLYMPIYHHIDIVDKYIIHEETKTNYVKELDYQGVKISVKDNTITLSSDTFTLDIKKTIKKSVVVPVEIK